MLVIEISYISCKIYNPTQILYSAVVFEITNY